MVRLSEVIGFAWFEERFFAKDGVHFASLWWAVCKKCNKSVYVSGEEFMPFLIPNTNISWDMCDFGADCWNLNCPYCENDDFKTVFNKTCLKYDEHCGKEKTYLKKWSDTIKEFNWMLKKELQLNSLNLGELDDTSIARDFIHTSMNWLPDYVRKSKQKKKKKKKKSGRKPISNKLRTKVLKRDNFTCQHCGKTVEDGAKLEVDHIIPVSLGGTDDMNNLQVLCIECNRGKSNDFCG